MYFTTSNVPISRSVICLLTCFLLFRAIESKPMTAAIVKSYPIFVLCSVCFISKFVSRIEKVHIKISTQTYYRGEDHWVGSQQGSERRQEGLSLLFLVPARKIVPTRSADRGTEIL